MSTDTMALEVEDLTVHAGGAVPVGLVRGVSFALRRGEVLGLVGESGSGKTLTALSLLRLVPAGLEQRGVVRIGGRAIESLSERDMRRLRGSEISMVFQDPMTALNPVRTIGSYLSEVARRHLKQSRGDARRRVTDALRATGIPSPEQRFGSYPHQLSGGLRQRAMIALALLNDPAVIVADEPTTALDSTIQAQILDLLRSRLHQSALLLVTHDLGVAREICDRIAVMYAGRIVEHGPAAQVLEEPRHPYTVGLLRAAPRFDRDRRPLVPIPGDPPQPATIGPGCAFAPRCPRADDRCRTTRPELVAFGEASAACWNPHE